MKPVDSHCHLHADKLSHFRDRAKQEAVEELEFVVDAGLDPETNQQVLNLADRSSQVVPAVGLHPTRTGTFDSVGQVVHQIEEGEAAAVGETGMDFHHVTDEEKRSRQAEVFERLLGVAARENLPVVCHTRNAEKEALDVLAGYEVDVYLHYFNGRPELAQEAVDRGYVIGLGPSLNWSDRAREIARTVPADNLLVETDSPYVGDKPTDVLSVCNVLRAIKDCSASDGVPFLDRLAQNASEFFSRDL